jgi:putative redox protein
MASEIKVVLRQVSASSSEATMGQHQVIIDRPVSKGGSDLGPMGGELFLSAIGGCFMSNLLAAMKARDADISDVSAENGDGELLEQLVKIADRGCIMMNTLRDKLELTIQTGAGSS